jgi:hypothetical protein
MKSRWWFVVAAVSIAVTLCVAVTFSNGQNFGGGDGKPNPFDRVLINDLDTRAPRDEGRFRIVTAAGHALLLDSRTGETWVLTAAKEGGKLSWIQVPRLRNGEKQEAAEREADEDSKPGSKEVFDPFK